LLCASNYEFTKRYVTKQKKFPCTAANKITNDFWRFFLASGKKIGGFSAAFPASRKKSGDFSACPPKYG